MKKTIKLVGVAIFAMSLVLVSCDDDIIDVLDIDFDTSISEDIPVVIDQGQESVNETLVVSLDNDDTHDYLSKIEDIDIKKITYKIIDFSGDETGTLNGTVSAGGVTLGVLNFIVSDNVNTVFEITDAAILNQVEDVLLDDLEVTVAVSGTCTALTEAMNFKISVDIDATITANPL